MDVADGDGEGIGGIGGLGKLGEFEEAGNHELDLLFLGEAVADDGGFDFERSILGYGKALHGRGQQSYAAHLTQLQGRLGVDRVEDLFDGYCIRLPTLQLSRES